MFSSIQSGKFQCRRFLFMRQCTHCQTLISENALFCGNCGVSYEVQAEQPTSTSNAPLTNNSNNPAETEASSDNKTFQAWSTPLSGQPESPTPPIHLPAGRGNPLNLSPSQAPFVLPSRASSGKTPIAPNPISQVPRQQATVQPVRLRESKAWILGNAPQPEALKLKPKREMSPTTRKALSYLTVLSALLLIIGGGIAAYATNNHPLPGVAQATPTPQAIAQASQTPGIQQTQAPTVLQPTQAPIVQPTQNPPDKPTQAPALLPPTRHPTQAPIVTPKPGTTPPVPVAFLATQATAT